MKRIVLTPLYGQNPCVENAAIAFSERQWVKVMKLRKSFPECWDPEYAAGVRIGNVKVWHSGDCEFFVCTSENLDYATPYAKVLTFGIAEAADLIVREEKIAVLKALKRHRTFQKLLKRYGWAEIVWAYVNEFDEVRRRKFPTFYVVVNTSSSPVELLVP
jgi:hypothetical protein